MSRMQILNMHRPATGNVLSPPSSYLGYGNPRLHLQTTDKVAVVQLDVTAVCLVAVRWRGTTAGLVVPLGDTGVALTTPTAVRVGRLLFNATLGREWEGVGGDKRIGKWETGYILH